jgi:WD40 repeat protein
MNVKAKALLKITAHSGESTTLAWHPIQPNVVATGGASDRCVKVWDLESYLSMKKDDSNMASNLNTMTSVMTETSAESGTSGYVINFCFCDGRRRVSPLSLSYTYSCSVQLIFLLNVHDSYSYSHGSVPARITMSSQSTLNSSSQSRHTKASPKNMLHVLSISAAVTRVRWRPPAGDTLILDDEDRHEAMLAVSTAPIKGASAGGSGLLALWSYHRPFMPLSVVEGHKDGAVTDFDWLDTPQPVQLVQATESGRGSQQKQSTSLDARQFRRQGSSHEVDAILYDNSEQDGGVDRPVGIWQHTISVGRDGRCLMQSFARGAFDL